jgi:alkylation response protein AidB-like acyl-CoA dehydrogenase
MDFSLSEEQTILADSIGRFIESDYDFEKRQKIAEGEDSFSREMWQTFAELGWTAVPFSEADGGLGGGPIELMLMMEQFGKGLVVEPYLANIVLAGGVLRRAASDEQKSRWLAPLIAGKCQASLAFAEPQARFDIQDIRTRATKSADGYTLTGRKNLVLNGGAADVIIVPARTAGDSNDADGITLFVVPTDATGLSRQTYPTVDAGQAADIALEDVAVSANAIVGEVDAGFGILADVIREATLAVSAEAVGIMQTMHDKTLDYTKNRVQFGVPIGTFQALQHRMVDTMIECEQSRSLLYWCVMLDAAGDHAAGKAVSALKYQVGTAGIRVAREAVQLHGGMGVTWELDIAHYFKRMTAIDILFGNADYHLDKFVDHQVHI